MDAEFLSVLLVQMSSVWELPAVPYVVIIFLYSDLNRYIKRLMDLLIWYSQEQRLGATMFPHLRGFPRVTLEILWENFDADLQRFASHGWWRNVNFMHMYEMSYVCRHWFLVLTGCIFLMCAMGNIFGFYMLYYISWDWLIATGLIVVVIFTFVSAVVFFCTVRFFHRPRLFHSIVVCVYVFTQIFVFFISLET